jgi:hypothetical protein
MLASELQATKYVVFKLQYFTCSVSNILGGSSCPAFLDSHSTPLPMHNIKLAFYIPITIGFDYTLSCSSIPSFVEESQQSWYQYLISVLSCA